MSSSYYANNPASSKSCCLNGRDLVITAVRGTFLSRSNPDDIHDCRARFSLQLQGPYFSLQSAPAAVHVLQTTAYKLEGYLQEGVMQPSRGVCPRCHPVAIHHQQGGWPVLRGLLVIFKKKILSRHLYCAKNYQINSAHADGGPRSRVWVCKTLRLAPHRQERKLSAKSP
jgi:hypothetical protein